MKNILVVEDDVPVGNLLQEVLTKEGYQVSRAYSGTEALLLLSQRKSDLILLDLMLPGLSGEDIIGQLKKIPVIVVSAKIDVQDKVSLLLGGAVDYITKPFHVQELLARVAVQFRDSAGSVTDSSLTVGELRLNPDTHIAAVNQREVRLTRTECAIFKLLLQNPSQVLTKSLLLERISEDTPDCTESSLKIHISNLRKKLREIGGKDYIEAVWGIGVILKCE